MNQITHSKLPPSSAARRMACPGSRAMEEKYGHFEETSSSIEGTEAHELASYFLRSVSRVNLRSDIPASELEKYESAEFYASTVRQFIPWVGSELQIEERVEITSIHPEMFGTPDAWGIDSNNSLHIFDYKYGFTPIDVFENWQLIAYACGITQVHNVTDIYLHIIQPRDYVSSSKHKMWHLTSDELEVYRKRLQISEALAMSPNASLRVSEQCKNCKARHACLALRQAAFGATEVAFRDAPQGLDPQQVGGELKLLHEARDLLEYRISALETEVEHLLKSGQRVDNYELTTTESRLNWSVSEKEVLDVGKLMGLNLSKESIITPTQAIKLGMPENVVLEYAQRKQNVKLSKIDIKKSKQVFNNTKGD